MVQSADDTLIVAGLILAKSHTVRQVDAVFQNQFLIKGFLIFFICQPSILIHGPQNILFSFFVVIRVLIRIVPGGRIGNANNAGALGSGQAFQLLAVISSSSTTNTAATLAKVDKVQIHFQDLIFIIALLNLHRPENLHHLTLNGNIVSCFIFRQQRILNQLLGNTGAAHRVITKEHSGAGLDGSNPVNALMLIEAMILDGYSCMNHIFRDVFNIRPGAAGGSKNVLIFLDITIGVQIVHIGVLLQVVVLNINIGHRQHIVLQVITKNTHKNKRADHNNHCYCACSTCSNFKGTKSNTPCRIQQAQEEIGFPLLTGRFWLVPFILSVEHSIPPKGSKLLPW